MKHPALASWLNKPLLSVMCSDTSLSTLPIPETWQPTQWRPSATQPGKLNLWMKEPMQTVITQVNASPDLQKVVQQEPDGIHITPSISATARRLKDYLQQQGYYLPSRHTWTNMSEL
jgi:hypothetical protein